MFTSAGFGRPGKPGVVAAGPSVGKSNFRSGFSKAGNKSAPNGTASKTSLILSITSSAASKGLGAPSSEDLTSNNS